jgi:predicted DsbA family dithiol-disulfide isomerase
MHRPLEMHKLARTAAIAAQAAQRQGKGWEMHDKMFENRKELERDALITYAGAIGLDVARFTADLDNPEVQKEVDSDNAIAESVGATGTPTFFINGRGLRGARPYEAFEEIVKAELGEVNKLIEAGTPLAEIYDKRCQANVAAGPPKEEG